MFKKRTPSIQSNPKENNDHCHCNNHNESYQIVENYRSILDRKQALISTWTVLQKNEKVTFTRGTRSRQGTDVFVIRSNHLCLVNPWYKYIDFNRKILSILEQNQQQKVYEVVLIECIHSTRSNQYEPAIIECPCLEQLKTHCAYCRFTLTATEALNTFLCTQPLKNILFPLQHSTDDEDSTTTEKLTNVPLSSMASNEFHESDAFTATESIIVLKTDDISIGSHSKLSSQHTIKSNEDVPVNRTTSGTLTKSRSCGTQTKLFAILLPPSPLSEMKQAKSHATTSINTTRSCQVNTLSYLIKTRDRSTEIQPTEKFALDESTTYLNPSIVMKHHPLSDHRDDEEGMSKPTINFEQNTLFNEELTFASSSPSPLKCVDICDAVDLDGPFAVLPPSSRSNTSFGKSDPTIIKHSTHHFNQNNNNEQAPFHRIPSDMRSTSKVCRFISTHYRRVIRHRRQYQNQKRVWVFLRRQHRRKKLNISHVNRSIPHSSSSFIITTSSHQPIKQQSPPSVPFLSNHVNTIIHHKVDDHALVVRASKHSTAYSQLQILLNDDKTSLETLLSTQLELTYHENYQSVCLLLDDHKQSEQYRSSFLHHLYTTLSNTLKRISHSSSIQLTSMNLVFFHNSFCDMVNKQRLRLIDTGRKILLSPSCEVPLKSVDDIDTALNRLSTNMSFAHQIFIINIYREGSTVSSSFLFLQLAPICSVRPTGLLTNLNTTTYSVLNLIRQFNRGQLFNQHSARRYLLNDCALNRLLKSYLFASQQTMTVLTIKRQIQSKEKDSQI